MLSHRGLFPDLVDHAIEKLVEGSDLTSAEMAAYWIWSDGIAGERKPMTSADKRRNIAIISDGAKPTFKTADAARKYAHARAHGKVRG